MIVTGNYGEAGALQRYGPAFGLPAVYSGQNNFHLWGAPPAGATTVIAVGMGEDRGWLEQYFGEVEPRRTYRQRRGRGQRGAGQSIWLCRRPLRPWAQLWPDFQHYD